MTIVNYASSIINKLEALLTDDARVLIYDRHVFIVQATCHPACSKKSFVTLIPDSVESSFLSFFSSA